MSDAEELKLLNIFAKNSNYKDWEDMQKNLGHRVTVWRTKGILEGLQSFARISVKAISLARKEGEKKLGIRKYKLIIKLKGKPKEIFELDKDPTIMITNWILEIGYNKDVGQVINLRDVFFKCESKDLEFLEISSSYSPNGKEVEARVKKEIAKEIKRLKKETLKLPKGLQGHGGMLCPSNPEFYEHGYLSALESLESFYPSKEVKRNG